jgi:UDP-GlcNAc:undecaprenyl-phosphate GlcNAc-1-phosphate transferase
MISYEVRIVLIFISSYLAVIFTLPKLAHIAQRLGLLDQPNERKMHTIPRPLVGGIGMVIAVTFASLIFIPISGLRGYFLGIALLLFVGFLDDFREIGHKQKFIAQILAAALMIYFSKVVLISFGDLLGIGEIIIPGGVYVAWVVTTFCIVGVINAVNLIDGLDGLAGGISFIAFVFFAIHSFLAGNHSLMLLNLALAGAVLGFLRFNWHPAVLFMGDAGSLCLGFSLAFMALAITQDNSGIISPVSALLVLAIPITDTIIVMFKRILRRQNPFVADKYHLHHIFLRYGMGRIGSVRVILLLSMVMGGLSLLQPLCGVAEAVLFFIFVVYFIVYLISSFYIVGFLRYSLKFRKNRAKTMSAGYFLRLVYGVFDIFRIFRKSRRYNVDIGVQISPQDDAELIRGKLLNISRTGCMMKVKGEGKVQVEMELQLELPFRDHLKMLHVKSEHLWVSAHDGASYHGFRFSNLSQSDEACLESFILQLNNRETESAQEVAA